MLTIRNEQMQAFQRIDPPAFEREMVEHIGRYFPGYSALLGPGQVSKIIATGWSAASRHGFTTRHQTCLFIDLRIMLGCGFDTDPQLPWAAAILKRTAAGEGDARIDRLYARACAYLDAVVGPDQVFPVAALRRLREYRMEEVELRLDGGEERILREFEPLWPGKYRYVGRENLLVMLQQTAPLAHRCGFTGPAASYYLLLAYTLGHRFLEDPAFPWFVELFASSPFERADAAWRRLYDVSQKFFALELREGGAT